MKEKKESSSEKREQKGVVLKRKHIIILALLLLLLVAGGILLGMYLSRSDDTPPGDNFVISDDASPGNNFVIDDSAGDWQGETPSGGSSDTIKIPGYPEIPIAAGQKNISIALLNPEGNPCYFKFELVLEDTEEILYTSDWVPPGQAVSRQTLSRELAKGSYKAVIRITTASLDESHSPMNGSNVKTTLNVQ